ncbi:ABC transporter ATP-binding protein [Corynebacterium sp. A21]|uniref:ABC transporter ATP-binding protein n=1 Tax=Corynebacterium sp. A21 TaxID=3457318 RepID=UPI003FCFCCD3
MSTPAQSADLLQPATLTHSFRHLRSLPSRPGPRWFLLALPVFLLTLLGMVGSSNLLGFSVDIIAGQSLPLLGGGARGFALLLLLVAGCLLLETTGRAGAGYLITSRTRRLSVDLRKDALSATLKAPVPEVLALGTGNVITRLTQDIDTAVRITSMIGVRLMITVLMFPATLISLGLIHWGYLLLFGLVALILVPGVRTVLIHIPPASNIVSSAEARRNNLLLDTIRGAETLRALNLGTWATNRMALSSWNAVQARADRTPIFTRILGLGFLAYGLLLLSSFALGTWLVHAGTLSPGAATAAVILIVRMEIHVFNVMFFASEIQTAVTGLGRAVSLATLSGGQARRAEPADLILAPEVKISGLSYAYPGGAAVLQNLDLTLSAGTTTALVGTSGAGKSTLAALIAGLQRPDAGRVWLGGVDTREVSDTWTARQVTLLSQEVHLFSGPLRRDLRMAAPGAADAVLIDALAKVGLAPGTAHFARWFPQGLDTPIGAGAEELAPEIAQQIALARVVLRDPPVLIMDEATSEAGSDNSRMLEQAATAVAQGRTSLVVAHRLDQAMAADRVIVMAQGEIVEDGTPAQLLAAGGYYAGLYRRWRPGATGQNS